LGLGGLGEGEGDVGARVAVAAWLGRFCDAVDDGRWNGLVEDCYLDFDIVTKRRGEERWGGMEIARA